MSPLRDQAPRDRGAAKGAGRVTAFVPGLASMSNNTAQIVLDRLAVGLWALASPWPDIAAGAFIVALFARLALIVAREARAELVRTAA